MRVTFYRSSRRACRLRARKKVKRWPSGEDVSREKVAIVEAYLRGLAGKGIGASDPRTSGDHLVAVTSSMRDDKC